MKKRKTQSTDLQIFLPPYQSFTISQKSLIITLFLQSIHITINNFNMNKTLQLTNPVMCLPEYLCQYTFGDHLSCQAADDCQLGMG